MDKIDLFVSKEEVFVKNLGINLIYDTNENDRYFILKLTMIKLTINIGLIITKREGRSKKWTGQIVNWLKNV